jgi:hypothetical protein
MSYGKIISIENEDDCCFHIIVIKTIKHTVKFQITTMQYCCEDFGYFTTQDDIKDYIGANLLDIREVWGEDVVFSKSVLEEEIPPGADVMFINIETSKGTLQYAIYNEHNGYYGHSVKVYMDGNKIISDTV